jgi:hypothetical protein
VRAIQRRLAGRPKWMRAAMHILSRRNVSRRFVACTTGERGGERAHRGRRILRPGHAGKTGCGDHSPRGLARSRRPARGGGPAPQRLSALLDHSAYAGPLKLRARSWKHVRGRPM